MRRFLRRGKALVRSACIASTNEANEYGRAVPRRGQPFRSSSNDVTQAGTRSNADYQYHVRALPDADGVASEHAGVALEQAMEADSSAALFFGWRKLPQRAKTVIIGLGVAMSAAHVADFYMTK